MTTIASMRPLLRAPGPKPLYMVLCCRGETYAEPIRHNPIGVTGDIYLHQDGAACLWDTSIGGQLPACSLPRGTEVILHLLGGMDGNKMAVDAARLLSEQYKNSARKLVQIMYGAGLVPIVYAGHPMLGYSEQSRLIAIKGLAQWCIETGAGLILDSSATLTYSPTAQAIKEAFTSVRNAGRVVGMEGISTKWARDELAPLVTHHFLELQSVERSFTDGWDWNPNAVPEISKVVVWDGKGKRSTRQEIHRLSGENMMPGQRSAIGAHNWRFHTFGGPRMILGGGSLEVRNLLRQVEG